MKYVKLFLIWAVAAFCGYAIGWYFLVRPGHKYTILERYDDGLTIYANATPTTCILSYRNGDEEHTRVGDIHIIRGEQGPIRLPLEVEQ